MIGADGARRRQRRLLSAGGARRDAEGVCHWERQAGGAGMQRYGG